MSKTLEDINKVETKVFKNGNSQSLSLRKSIMKEAGIEIGDKLDCYVKDGKIVFEKKGMSLKDELKEYFDNGGTYKEYDVVDLGQQGREF